MTELYWITRLDALCGFLFAITVVSITIVILSSIALISSMVEKQDFKMLLKCVKIFTSILFVVSILLILTPTTKEAMMIYGVGGTIDYIKTNDTAKQIPDKCIKAVDLFLDDVNSKLETP